MIERRLKEAHLVVIKVGSNVLLKGDGQLNRERIAHIAQEIAELKRQGHRVILVSSGAIGAGLQALSLKSRPKELRVLQAAAAVGQVKLMGAYVELFDALSCKVAQVLLTHDDLKDRSRHLNVHKTINELLLRDIIPIINENDTVAVDEIRFGDNDILASLVAMLLEAKILILLTTAEGFMITNAKGDKERLPHIVDLNDDLMRHIEAHRGGLSTGGMKSKIMAASNMIHVGGIAIIAPGLFDNVLTHIFQGKDIGTLVGPLNDQDAQRMPKKKRWIAFYHRAQGMIEVDDGAKHALTSMGKSLLPVGITKVLGPFRKGSVVDIMDRLGNCFAKGIAQMDHHEIDIIKGGSVKSDMEVIHRDNLVILVGATYAKN